MKKPYLLTALLLSTLMLAGCGDEKPSTGGDTGTDTEQGGGESFQCKLNFSPTVLDDGHNAKAHGCNVESVDLVPSLMPGTTVEYKVTVGEGYEIYSMRINGVEVDHSTRTITVKEGTNTVDVVFYNPTYIKKVDFTLPDEWIDSSVADFSVAKNAAKLKEHSFSDPIFDQTQTLAPYKVLGLQANEKGKKLPCVRFGAGDKKYGKLEVKLDASKNTDIYQVYVDAIPYTTFKKYNEETKQQEDVFEQEKASFTIDGTNYVDIDKAAGTSIDDIHCDFFTVFDEEYCAKLTDKLVFANSAPVEEENPTDNSRVWVKSILIAIK